MTRTIVQAFAGLAFLLVVIAAALFVSAGTLRYWQAWVFLANFGAGVVAITLYLVARDRALLARRVHAGPLAERTRLERAIQSVASLAFLAIFVISALDHRDGWSHVGEGIVAAGDALVALGLGVVFLVFRANTYTSAVIEVGRDQRLVTHGPYAVVRHPMYAGALVMLAGVPVALGSWWGLAAVAPLVAAIVARLLDEEKLLTASLAGYAAYRARVRFRLVRFVW